ncbi:Krueppel-like factor 8 [Ranitomeya imitator]|uniref:Krueppel-like factor 8 n=1 Tax=Ranitomeya imitator TaxID=111125 RepID=UPI0037E8A08D
MPSHCKVDAETSTPLLTDIKMEPPEQLLDSDCSMPQAEPVDLSLHKPKSSIHISQSPPPTTSTLPTTLLAGPQVVSLSGFGSAVPAVLSPGSILASMQGSGGQQILHVIHTIPSVNLPTKMGGLPTILVVVQSLPVVYTTMPTDGVTAAITVSLIGADGKTTAEFMAVTCHNGCTCNFWQWQVLPRVCASVWVETKHLGLRSYDACLGSC